MSFRGTPRILAGRLGEPRRDIGSALRNGVTLVELTLVLVLLVVIGAIAAPLLNETLVRAELRHSGDVLRSAWAKARLAAMQTGSPYVFRFEPNGSRYQTISLAAYGSGESPPLAKEDPDKPYDTIDIFRLSQNRLPDGVIFSHADISSSNQMMALLPDAANENWSAPIIFNADGTTSDASVILSNEDKLTIRVTLRGLTGISKANDIGDEVQQ